MDTSIAQVDRIRRELVEFDRANATCPVDKRRYERQAEQKRKAREAEVQKQAVSWDQRIQRQIDRWWGRTAPTGGWYDMLFDAIAEVLAIRRAEDRKEVKAAIEEALRKADGRLAALEECIWQLAIGRARHQGEIATHDDEAKRGVVIRGIDEVRAETRKWVAEQIEAERRSFEAMLVALEDRLKSVPGKLPPVKTYREGGVIYQGEIATCDGALW